MANNQHQAPDPEDMFSETRMSFGDHIEDLRTHLFRAIKCFVVGMVISFWPLGFYVMKIIVAPVEEQLSEFKKRTLATEIDKKNAEVASDPSRIGPPLQFNIRFDRKALKAALSGEESKAPIDEVQKQQTPDFVEVPVQIANPWAFTEQNQKLAMELDRPRLTTMKITEAFFVYLEVAMLTGLVLSSPWVFYHIWAFIAAGLYPQEKKIVNVYLPFSVSLFIVGVLVAQFLVMPRAIKAMLLFNEWLGLSADLRLEEWLSFALMTPVVFGLSFQTPLVMMFFHKVGIFSVQTYRERRRIAWFAMAFFAAIIAPTVDFASMTFLWVPMVALYEFGILLCIWQGEKQTSLLDWEEEKRDELVEV